MRTDISRRFVGTSSPATDEENAGKALMAAKPADVAELIAFLVSPHATSVTGAKYVIDGTVPTG